MERGIETVWPFALYFILVVTIGVLGNLFVIFAILSNGKMRRPAMNRLILSLAIADFFNLLAACPDIGMQLFGEGWVLSAVSCKAIRYMLTISIYASVLSQVVIAIERFIVIVLPMKGPSVCSPRSSNGVAIGIFIGAALLALPIPIYSTKVPMHDNMTHICMPMFPQRQHLDQYAAAQMVVFYLLPLVVTAVLYLKVIMVLWSRNQPSLRKHKLNKGERFSEEQRIVLLMIACVTTYFLCYSPVQVLTYLQISHTPWHIARNASFRLAVNGIVLFNSAANPILYTVISSRFRRRFWAILNRKSSEDNMSFKATFVRHGSRDKSASPVPVKITIDKLRKPQSCQNLLSTRNDSLLVPMATVHHYSSYQQLSEPIAALQLPTLNERRDSTVSDEKLF